MPRLTKAILSLGNLLVGLGAWGLAALLVIPEVLLAIPTLGKSFQWIDDLGSALLGERWYNSW